MKHVHDYLQVIEHDPLAALEIRQLSTGRIA